MLDAGKYLLFALLLCNTSSAFAFRFSPIYATIRPNGKENSATFTVENNQNEKVAIQLRVVKREEDTDGIESNETVAADFNLFPTQLLMGPGQVKKVRLTWTGKDIPKEELPFRLLAEQLDIQGLEAKKTTKAGKIKILMAYRASVYVEPPNVQANVVTEETQVIKENKESKLNFILKNNGTKHQVMVEPILAIAFKDENQKDVSISLEGKDLAAINDLNLLPGKIRKVSLPWSGPTPSGPITLDLKVKPE